MVAVKTKKPRDYIFEQIKALVQCKLWRVCKFVTSDEDRAKVTAKICSLCDFEGDSNPAQEAKWCKLNEKKTNRAVNDIRAYSQCEIKKKLATYWTYNKKTLPSLDDFKACLKRTINYEDKAQKNIWKFWADQILDAACANKFDWNPAVRYFNKISTASDGEGESQFNMLMNPSTEAWAMICIENYYDSWQKQFEWKEKKFPKEHSNVQKESNFEGRGAAFSRQQVDRFSWWTTNLLWLERGRSCAVQYLQSRQYYGSRNRQFHGGFGRPKS